MYYTRANPTNLKYCQEHSDIKPTNSQASTKQGEHDLRNKILVTNCFTQEQITVEKTKMSDAGRMMLMKR